jgi:hypothetical protein
MDLKSWSVHSSTLHWHPHGSPAAGRAPGALDGHFVPASLNPNPSDCPLSFCSSTELNGGFHVRIPIQRDERVAGLPRRRRTTCQRRSNSSRADHRRGDARSDDRCSHCAHHSSARLSSSAHLIGSAHHHITARCVNLLLRSLCEPAH